jgi:hypothetical protein
MAAVIRSGFVDHAVLVFTEHPEGYFQQAAPATHANAPTNYVKNRMEQIGEALMWHATHLPVHVYNALHNSKVLVVAFTILALIAVQFAFYPTYSIFLAVQIGSFLYNYISLAAPMLKLMAYISVQSVVLGWGTRAMGRLNNADLMARFTHG